MQAGEKLFWDLKLMNKQTRILILGAGFGGLYCAIKLNKLLKHRKDIQLTLVDKKNYFQFSPLIHEVASGGLSRDNVVQPLRQMFRKNLPKIIETKVESIDTYKRKVFIAEGILEYDFLIIALGATNQFFSTQGAEAYALTLKEIKDAVLLRNRLIHSYDKASKTQNNQRQKDLLRVVVVGGGPTGVEVAGELADLANDELLKAYPDIKKGDCEILLLQSADRLVPQAVEKFSNAVLKKLEKLGVNILCATRVNEVMPDGVVCNKETRINAGLVVWTAGVKANDVKINPDLPKDKNNRINVESTLQLKDFPEVFVIGDQACLQDKETGQPYPMRAQFASRQGKFVAKNINRLLNGGKVKNFFYQDQGFIVSVGQWQAVADLYGFVFSGRLAWWIYRTIYLFKLVGLRNKVKVALDWTVNLFLPRDISEL
jgi:NADH:ubiquinone reductase (H+-translocating)